MGSGDSKPATGAASSRKRRKESPLLPHEEGSGKARQGQGSRLLGPSERSERRYLRNYYDLDDGRARGGGGGSSLGDHGGLSGGFVCIAADDGVADIDQTIDRYDYLIAFPHPSERVARGRRGRTELAGSAEEESDGSDSEGGGYEDAKRITLTEVNDIWYSAVPGDEVTKTAAKQSLAREWEARFRTPSDDSEEVSISHSEWVRLAREVIVNTLFERSGLQLKLTLSKNGDRVLCRIRAPIVLLERQAAREGYRLQFRGEVDPGETFWTEDEITEELRLYGKDEANETLEKLFEAEKISPNDLAVFDEEVAPNQWSRRAHALERIADRVPVANRFPAYAEYTNDDKHRHLFQTYPSIRGRTIFRAKDRLALTKGIIDSFFDMGVLQARGVVDAVCALHDANRGEVITKEVLQKRWTLGFWRESSDRVGAPMLSMKMMDHGHSAPWFLQLFCQPLDEIRDYFGEKMAFYFAWLGFYAWALTLPALYGVGMEIYILVNGITFDDSGWKFSQVSMAVGTVLWSVIYQELWGREEKIVAVKWGTSGFEEIEKDRPNFEGDKDSPGGGRRRSPVTNTFQTYYPEHKRKIRQALGLVVVLLFVAGLLCLVGLVEWLEHYLESDLGYEWAGYATSVLASLQIQFLSFIYSHVVRRLNDFENYRTETAYDNNLIFKTFLFQMFNNYSALFYTAFIEGEVYGCTDSCMTEVRTLLIAIFCVRFVMVGAEVGVPLLTSRMRNASAKSKRRERNKVEANGPRGSAVAGGGRGASSAATGGAAEDGGGVGGMGGDEEPMEAELRLPMYDGPFSDYSEIVLQYGYITMFASALPIVTFFAIAEVLLQIRTDSYKMVSLMRRPEAEMAEGVGMWSTLMEAMGFLAVLTNTAIICFTGGTLDTYSSEDKFLVWLVFEHALLLLKVLIHVTIPDQPASLAITKARQRFVVQKHLHGFVQDGGGDAHGEAGESQRRGNLDIVGLQFDEKQRGRQLPPGAFAQLGRLRTELRDVTRGLKIVKEQLQGAYEHETFNEQTGIGETKHGLPLGCLNIKLIRLDGMEGDPQATTVVMSLRNSRQGDKTPPGPALQSSRPAERGSRIPAPPGGSGSDSGTPTLAGMMFSQVFVMAPIRSQDAEIVFDVTQTKQSGTSSLSRGGGVGAGGSSAAGAPRRAGTCRVSLRELADQREHDLPLTVLKKANNRWVPSPARLYVKIKFMYSKIVPLRNRIYALQDRKRSMEKEITLLQIGGGAGAGEV
ncbi:unnamed protein product [Scytosiphon promiscuus]